jgi:hypothetical protein
MGIILSGRVIEENRGYIFIKIGKEGKANNNTEFFYKRGERTAFAETLSFSFILLIFDKFWERYCVSFYNDLSYNVYDRCR